MLIGSYLKIVGKTSNNFGRDKIILLFKLLRGFVLIIFFYFPHKSG